MKIGLIAMSGVRVHNQQLMELGLTLPGFVERSKVIASLPSLALLTLAGMTPAWISLEYLEVPDLATIDHLPGAFDAVAIASYSAMIGDAYTLADRYRREGTRVILGGLHVTAMPQEALQHADAVVLGEAEPVWPQVLHDLQAGRLQRIYDARRMDFDLAEAPMPRFELLDIDRYNRLTVQTQRGCLFSCEFCASSIRISPRFKVKPVARVIEEIRRIRQLWPRPFIEFADDNSFANRAHGKRLLRALAKEEVRWFTETDLSIADDDELLALMRDSGCAQVLIGFESPDSGELDGIELKSNWKASQAERYLEAIDKIQGHGISVNGCFILGLDGSGPESFDAVFDFVRQSGLDEVQVTLQTPFPGTPLYDRLRDTQRLIDAQAWERCTLFDVNFEPDGMRVDELEQGFADLIARLYEEDLVARRRAAFRRRLRANRRS